MGWPARPHTALTHGYWWRGDWPVAADVVSYQTSPHKVGPKAPRWVALDPSLMEEHQEVIRQAREAFAAWQRAQAERKASRSSNGPSSREGTR